MDVSRKEVAPNQQTESLLSVGHNALIHKKAQISPHLYDLCHKCIGFLKLHSIIDGSTSSGCCTTTARSTRFRV
ncbi:hypothetical protein Pint_06028 [Pistacia integerrima]|uniref:Uncharacterized protein n=1 Tax=Pistacia integerrima TaxID=434235 RepID=A0ACC0Z1V6_9ROSI|nr:hypothetical protein Pint_06028 [Pistacia integerrima]